MALRLLRGLLLGLCLVRNAAGAPGATGAEASAMTGGAGPPVLWAALRRVTGFSDEELQLAAEDLLRLPEPSQRPVWTEHVHCGPGTCAGELVARSLAALAEGGKLPLRAFEPHRGDPLYDLWQREDKTEFHSWADGLAGESLGELMPEGQPLAIGRFQAAQFIRSARELVENITTDAWGAAGRCLEWDTPFYEVKGFGGLCRYHDVVVYADELAGRQTEMRDYNFGTRLLSLDIQALPEWAPRDYGLIICLFVLEHVPEPALAMRNLARMLLVGGFLLVGAPFLDGVHGCPDDYYRYTPHGLRYLAEAVGLEVLWSYSPGSASIATGEHIGLKSSYWAMRDLLGESDTHPTNVFLLARKPWRGRRERVPPKPKPHNRTGTRLPEANFKH